MKERQFVHLLKKAGVVIISDRGKGGHVLAKYRGRQTTIPIHSDHELSPDFLKMLVVKQLGLELAQVL
ncbi:MAG: type II toxin-antitoxin system HicA family toxin [Thermodesulfobacteriota bacterium]